MAHTPPVAVLVVEVDGSTNQVRRSFWEPYDDAVERWFRHQEIPAPVSLLSDTSFSAKLDTGPLPPLK